MTSTSIMSTLLNLKMANKAVAQAAETATDRKTLVCLFFEGGIDSYNMLVPNDDRYAEYATTRGADRAAGGVALTQEELLAISQYDIGGGILGDGQLYGLNPNMAPIQTLFNGLTPGEADEKRRLAFISNVGTLIEPTTMAEYHSSTYQNRPQALYSHSDQSEQWQTSLPQGGINLTGWAGRIADILHDTANSGSTSMSISFSGNNTMQVGDITSQFVMTRDGALSFSDNSGFTSGGNNYHDHPAYLKNIAVKSLLDQQYSNLMEQAFVDLTKQSINQQELVQSVFDSFDDSSITTSFPDNYLADQLYSALKMIALREQLGLTRQTIFISYGGWDHHGELLDAQGERLSDVAPAMLAFQQALEELGLADSVVTFTGSEFGRTLRSNGRGTDHAWGGNQMVMGGPVQGGRVYGNYPSLALRADGDNDYTNGIPDVGQGGRLLPSTSVDSFYGELIRWFGVSTSDIATVLPNYLNFHTNTTDLPLGFLKDGTYV